MIDVELNWQLGTFGKFVLGLTHLAFERVGIVTSDGRLMTIDPPGSIGFVTWIVKVYVEIELAINESLTTLPPPRVVLIA